MTLTLMALGLLAQAATDADDPAARLAYMKQVLERYDVHSADEPRVAYRLRPDPACRFTNPVGFSRDGAVFLWLADDGRPAAAVQISLARAGHWFHDVSSLSTDPEAFLAIEARPSESGLQWQYGLAPMTIYALRASLHNGEVWSVPHRPVPGPGKDPTAPFHALGTPRGL
jgi:hypothetical protein